VFFFLDLNKSYLVLFTLLRDNLLATNQLDKVSASDFETHVLGSTLTEALWFSQEGHAELKCHSALNKVL